MVSMRLKSEKVESNHISFSGHHFRSPTVLISLGARSISKKALILGVLLILCHVADGILTAIGTERFGLHVEGNPVLRVFMHTFGTTISLFAFKTISIIFSFFFMVFSHQRRWARPLMVLSIAFYLVMALGPWVGLLME